MCNRCTFISCWCKIMINLSGATYSCKTEKKMHRSRQLIKKLTQLLLYCSETHVWGFFLIYNCMI